MQSLRFVPQKVIEKEVGRKVKSFCVEGQTVVDMYEGRERGRE